MGSGLPQHPSRTTASAALSHQRSCSRAPLNRLPARLCRLLASSQRWMSAAPAMTRRCSQASQWTSAATAQLTKQPACRRTPMTKQHQMMRPTHLHGPLQGSRPSPSILQYRCPLHHSTARQQQQPQIWHPMQLPSQMCKRRPCRRCPWRSSRCSGRLQASRPAARRGIPLRAGMAAALAASAAARQRCSWRSARPAAPRSRLPFIPVEAPPPRLGLHAACCRQTAGPAPPAAWGSRCGSAPWAARRGQVAAGSPGSMGLLLSGKPACASSSRCNRRLHRRSLQRQRGPRADCG